MFTAALCRTVRIVTVFRVVWILSNEGLGGVPAEMYSEHWFRGGKRSTLIIK